LIELSENTKTVVTGFGYTGERLCRALRKRQCAVTSIVRNDSAHAKLEALGCQTVNWDLDQVFAGRDKDGLRNFAWMDKSILFHLAPPPPRGRMDTRLNSLLQQISSAPPAALILASTSGVYGDRQGDWIDETAPLNPLTDRAYRRVHAEQTAKAFCDAHGVRLVVLRIAGIYGAGRLPVKRLASRTPLPPSDEIGYTNRIHVDDLVRVLIAAAERAAHGSVFNVADGVPCSTRDWFEQVARLVGMPPPPMISLEDAEAELTPMFMSFLRESRRLDIGRLRDELKVKLAYAEPEIGIRASLAVDMDES